MREDFTYRVDDREPGLRKEKIKGMFDDIVSTYDLLNRILSLGIDRGWRKRVVRNAGSVTGRPVLDVCCGTGDLSNRLTNAGAMVFSLDFSHAMLKTGKARGWLGSGAVAADAARLPFRSESFALLTIAFGIRNIPDINVFMAEARRVLVPGGMLQILELTRPSGMLMKMAYRLYIGFILPLVGGLVSGKRDAYRYLAGTIATFLDPDELAMILKDAGFSAVRIERQTGGIATIFVAERE
ncbi:MAG: dimethylmenaquinone methyltransferase [Spirochaetae bacterium HGW-Spirochaetae-1]|nr:MAG: dimethylmenaquinone methyltransferase [Spirochaetae bacterium HGW-Spirochaetae-1]